MAAAPSLPWLAPVAIYDDDCRACVGFAKLVRLLDIRHQLRLIPVHSNEAGLHAPTTELQKRFHVVVADGRNLSGGEAMGAVLGFFPGFFWVPRAIRDSRGLRRAMNRVYGWLARNRGWISFFA